MCGKGGMEIKDLNVVPLGSVGTWRLPTGDTLKDLTRSCRLRIRLEWRPGATTDSGWGWNHVAGTVPGSGPRTSVFIALGLACLILHRMT